MWLFFFKTKETSAFDKVSHTISCLFNNRNPDAEPGGPWCYTTDRNVRWEYCDIPRCKRKIFHYCAFYKIMAWFITLGCEQQCVKFLAFLIKSKKITEMLEENGAESQRIETVTLLLIAQQYLLFNMLLPVLVYLTPCH